VFLVFTYAELLRRPIEQITRQMQDLQQAGASLNRVTELLELRSSVADNGTRELAPGALDVRFEKVHFGYEAGDPVLDGVTLHIPAGTRLGLLGRTGSGKTTLSRLLFRLYDVDGGAVLLGGGDARDVRLAVLRSRVGLVTQEIQLFHATLRDNLSMFDPSIDDARVVDALEQLGLDAWLHTLPDGLNTVLAPGGGLSAGEAQLLAFARVSARSVRRRARCGLLAARSGDRAAFGARDRPLVGRSNRHRDRASPGNRAARRRDRHFGSRPGRRIWPARRLSRRLEHSLCRVAGGGQRGGRVNHER